MSASRFARLLATLALLVAPAAALDDPQERIDALRGVLDDLERTAYEDRDEAWVEQRVRARYHLARGLAGFDPGSDRAFYQDQAIVLFEDLALEVGETSAVGLHAYAGLGDIYAQRRDWEQAAVFYQFVARTLLDEEGVGALRLEPVPQPDLEPADEPRRAVSDGGGSAYDEPEVEEPEEAGAYEDRDGEGPYEEAARAYVDVESAEASEQHLSRVRDAFEAGEETSQEVPMLRVLRELTPGLKTALRADLLLGDIHYEQGEFRSAAEHYGRIVQELAGAEGVSGTGYGGRR